jgi:NAD(P)-dependent dehydrogenase (short-subunit alcohol dehydrogenase family)
MGSLERKVAIVVGGTSGIGAQTARLFAAEGATVLIAGRRRDEGEILAAELGASTRFVRADVMVESDVAALIQAAVGDYERLDVLVNNAGDGGVPPGGLASIDLAEFGRMLSIHAGGVLAGMKHAAPVMIEQGFGSIINTASTSGSLAGWSGTAYSAAKAAIIQLTRCAAIELGQYGIRANTISPGPVLTGIFGKAAGMDPAAADQTAAQLEPAFVEALEGHQSLRRAGMPADVANAALWLASDASSFVTGQNLIVDGGITAGRPVSVSVAERSQLAQAFAALT